MDNDFSQKVAGNIRKECKGALFGVLIYQKDHKKCNKTR